MKRVVVQDYDPDWPVMFERLRAVVWSAVSEVAVTIEHVGSTAVPGLAAKPVIDVDVVVPALDVERAITALSSLGYVHRGDLGIAQREAFGAPAGSLRHHLYLCPSDSPALENHLLIRDHLRRDEAAARAYGALKKRLALKFADDIDGYMEGKSGFLLEILRKAGMSKENLAEIERQNRRPDPDRHSDGTAD